MATRQQVKTGGMRSTVRKRQRGERDKSKANHTYAHKQKIREEQAILFHDTPVRDGEWQTFPYADADVPASKRESAKHLAIIAMGEWGVVAEASRASGIGRTVLFQLMRNDAAFRKRMRGAQKNCIERIEREMIRRAQLKGGELAGIYITKHNILKYREIQRVELTGKGGAPVAYIDAKAELLKRLEEIVRKQKASDEVMVVGGGRGPRLLKGGGSEGKGEIEVRKVDKGKGWSAQSRK